MAVLLLLNLARRKRVKENYSTAQAARKIGVGFRTLNRWLSLGKITPSMGIPLRGSRTLWRWTDADITKARKVKAAQKTGPKPNPKRRKQ